MPTELMRSCERYRGMRATRSSSEGSLCWSIRRQHELSRKNSWRVGHGFALSLNPVAFDDSASRRACTEPQKQRVPVAELAAVRSQVTDVSVLRLVVRVLLEVDRQDVCRRVPNAR